MPVTMTLVLVSHYISVHKAWCQSERNIIQYHKRWKTLSL